MEPDHLTNRIQAVQEALAKQGLLHGARDRGKLDAATLDALLAWSTTNREAGSAAGLSTNSVDFPGFVSDLINGVFDALVNVSAKQTGAYIELLRKSVAGHHGSKKHDGDCGD